MFEERNRKSIYVLYLHNSSREKLKNQSRAYLEDKTGFGQAVTFNKSLQRKERKKPAAEIIPRRERRKNERPL